MHETPVPDGIFREHRLARCKDDVDVPRTVERYLGTCSEFFRDGSGSDGMIEIKAPGHNTFMKLFKGSIIKKEQQGIRVRMGTVHFEVLPTKKAHPEEIIVSHGRIQVLGTEFTVKVTE